MNNNIFVFFFRECSVLCLFWSLHSYYLFFNPLDDILFYICIHIYTIYTHMPYWMVCLPPLVSELFLLARLPSPYLNCKNCPRSVSYLTSLRGPMALSAPSALQQEAPAQGGGCWAESSSHEPSVNAKSRFWLSARTRAPCYAFCHCLPYCLFWFLYFFFCLCNVIMCSFSQ